MANAKISALTSYTPPVNTDVIPIVDTTLAITKKITWANIKTALTSVFAPLAGANFTGNIVMSEKNISGNSTSLNDDAAMSITPGNYIGIILIFNRTLSGVDTTSEPWAIINYDTTDDIGILSITKSTNTVLATGALTGTTGADGKFTISVHTDHKIYMENRLGGSRYFGDLSLGN
jgi:hypothetical protein